MGCNSPTEKKKSEKAVREVKTHFQQVVEYKSDFSFVFFFFLEGGFEVDEAL